jgi:TDG/mug DNA glycosylase family protein
VLTDILAPDLQLVFVGFNPSTIAWRAGHYYANPVNNFYRLLHRHGLTPVQLPPSEDRRLIEFGIGVVDLLAGKHSPHAGDYPASAYRKAVPDLERRLSRVRPKLVCFNGLGVARFALGDAAKLGSTGVEFAGAKAFVVPSTSGAANGKWKDRERAFATLAAALER